MPPIVPADYKIGNIQKLREKNPRRGRWKKPHDCWPDGPFNAVTGEEALWKAVIVQAIQDAVANGRKSQMQWERRDAMRWISGNCRDFNDVCLRAGLDPDRVRICAKKALVNPSLWRTEAGESREYRRRKAIRKRHKRMKKEARKAARAARRQAAASATPSPALVINMFPSKKERRSHDQ